MKRTNRLIFVVVMMIGSSINSFGQQYKDFDLGTYKLPDIVRNELDFSLSSAGDFNDQNSADRDAFNIGGNLQTAFKRYKNTATFRGWHNAEFQVGGKYSRSGEYKKNNNYKLALSYDNTCRFYNDKQIYFGTGGFLHFSTQGENEQDGGYEIKDKATNIAVTVPLVVGKGRIEEVKDARQAVYILDNLTKRGVLKRKLSNQEVYELAQIISTVKNKRFLDSRLRMIDEITTVDSFFVKNDLLSTVGAPYFTTLYDYWMYGDLFSRGSGMELEGGIRPGFEYTYRLSDDKIIIPRISANLSLTYEKPVNLYWQRSAFAGLGSSYSRANHAYDNQTEKVNQYDVFLNGEYKWGYYPNSRTNINMNVFQNLAWFRNEYKSSPLEEISQLTSVTALGVGLYYYFSPQLRLSANANLQFQYNRMIEDKVNQCQFQGNFMATLTYSLF